MGQTSGSITSQVRVGFHLPTTIVVARAFIGSHDQGRQANVLDARRGDSDVLLPPEQWLIVNDDE